MTSRQLFKQYLIEQQWSSAASVSVDVLKSADQTEINWYFDTLMDNCNRWRVVRMVKTWVANDLELDMNQPYGQRMHQEYRKTVWSTLSENTITDLQRQRRQEFNRIHFQPYPLQDRLVMWLNQGKLTQIG